MADQWTRWAFFSLSRAHATLPTLSGDGSIMTLRSKAKVNDTGDVIGNADEHNAGTKLPLGKPLSCLRLGIRAAVMDAVPPL